MNTYIYLDSDGYISYSVSSNDEQPNGILLDFEIPEQPFGNYKFNYSSKQWVLIQDPILATAEALKKRIGLLQASDWTQLPDVAIDTKSQWAAYRQALRDITTQSGYPFNIVWPSPPT
jgi:hypothetical protein